MLALPSVILMMIYGQTRIFFVMARDGLLPEKPDQDPPQVEDALHRDRLHRHLRWPSRRPCSRSANWPTSRTPARCSPSSWCRMAVMILRVKEPNRAPSVPACRWSGSSRRSRPRGCAFLFWNLPHDAKMVLPIWGGIGLVIYFLYGYRQEPCAAAASRGPRAGYRHPAAAGHDLIGRYQRRKARERSRAFFFAARPPPGAPSSVGWQNAQAARLREPIDHRHVQAKARPVSARTADQNEPMRCAARAVSALQKTWCG